MTTLRKDLKVLEEELQENGKATFSNFRRKLREVASSWDDNNTQHSTVLPPAVICSPAQASHESPSDVDGEDDASAISSASETTGSAQEIVNRC